MNTRIPRAAMVWLMTLTVALGALSRTAVAPPTVDEDRGDVPGWVMITVMTVSSSLGCLIDDWASGPQPVAKGIVLHPG